MKTNKITKNLIIVTIAYILAIFQICRASGDINTRMISITIITFIIVAIFFILMKRENNK